MALIRGIIFLGLLLASSSYGDDKTGRLGLGISNQFKGDIQSLSFKLKRTKSMAFGGMLALSNDPDVGGFGAGVKAYNILLQEPFLNFYLGTMGGIISKRIRGDSYTGFQVDLTLGTEFSFQEIESLGFSFEFGASINKLKNFVFETSGSHFIGGAVHFYL